LEEGLQVSLAVEAAIEECLVKAVGNVQSKCVGVDQLMAQWGLPRPDQLRPALPTVISWSRCEAVRSNAPNAPSSQSFTEQSPQVQQSRIRGIQLTISLIVLIVIVVIVVIVISLQSRNRIDPGSVSTLNLQLSRFGFSPEIARRRSIFN